MHPSLLTTLVHLLPLASAAVSEVIPTSDGLQIEQTVSVECDRPTRVGDTIAVHYAGTLENGEQFDASYNRGEPFEFELGRHQVISGWDEGLLGMCVGSERKLIIPPELGYGGRRVGRIPANSVLIFETKLMHIDGVDDPPPVLPPPEILPLPQTEEPTEQKDEQSTSASSQTSAGDAPSETTPASEMPVTIFGGNTNECRLLGPFALFVQSALGVLALFSLVFKRWRETPRRPLQIWVFDVSKQVLGTALLHIANLAMSMLSSPVDASTQAEKFAAQSKGQDDQLPNPCSFYLLNLAIDTTIGIPILVVLLKVLHALFSRTPLANPPESLKSGHYGTPAHVTWWMKQSLIYFMGLFGMKLFVLFLFKALPWLPWVGDWALRWTEGNESVQIAFVMFIFPLAMNMIQYYVIDIFIKEKPSEGYETVRQDDSSSGDDGSMDNEATVHDEDATERKAAHTVTTSATQGESSGSDASPVK